MSTSAEIQHPRLNAVVIPAFNINLNQCMPFLFLIGWGATTPLLIHWSMSGGIPFTFMAFARFLIAGLIGAVMLFRQRHKLALERRLSVAWLIAGVPSSLAMLLSYWLLQRISSGAVAVYLGVIPMMTGLFSWVLLKDRPSAAELACVALGMAGLGLIFHDSLRLGSQSWFDIGAGLLYVVLMAARAVSLKRWGGGLPADAINNGSLLVHAVILGLAWLLAGAQAPTAMPSALACGATLFMAVIGSVVAFAVQIRLVQLYRPMSASAITVVTPVLALWLGHAINGETVSSAQIIGTVLVITGLGLYLAWQQRRQANFSKGG